MPDYNASSIPTDDRSVQPYGIPHMTHQSTLNGQEQNYNLYNMRIAQGQNENSRYQEAEPYVFLNSSHNLTQFTLISLKFVALIIL